MDIQANLTFFGQKERKNPKKMEGGDQGVTSISVKRKVIF